MCAAQGSSPLIATAPCLPVKVGGCETSVLALVDTGAEVSLVGDYWAAAREKRVGDAVRVKGLTGQAVETGPQLTVQLTLENGKVVELHAIELCNSSRVVLGIPFLRQQRAVIDLERETLRLSVGTYPLVLSPKARVLELEVDAGGATKHEAEEVAAKAQLADDLKGRLKKILVEFEDLWLERRTGRTNVLEHPVNLTTRRPVCCGPRKYSLEQQEVIDQEVKKMLAAGICRESFSPYAAGVVLVKKKTGDWRFCVDYRPLNEVTVRDMHPLPRIKDLLNSIKTSKYFVALDLKAGYWQIAMREEDIPKTAFRTHRGLYEFVVMPFGLVNAPASFQRLMEIVLGDLRWRGVLVYLDDILIHATTPEDVLTLLEQVLKRLRQAGLTVNIDKSDFFPESLLYLGHVLSPKGIEPARKRVDALQALTKPTDLKGLRRLLGLFSYYREYIANFAAIVEPLTKLLKKGVRFEWSREQESALETLKGALMNKVLTCPLDGDDFVLETDASDYAVAAILSVERQEGRMPVEFASATLTGAERRWPTREKEAYAIVWALRKFEEYLRGRHVKVYTDHHSLQWLMAAKKGKLARWAQTLQEYELEVHYRKGTEGAHVDAFTRNPEEQETVEERMVYAAEAKPTQPSLPTIEEVREASKALKSVDIPKGSERCNGLYLSKAKIFVPPSLRDRVVAATHTGVMAGHPGVKRTVMNVKKVFWWPGIEKDVAQWVKSCLTCQRVKPGKERFQGLLRPHPQETLFDAVYMDIWGPVNYRDESFQVLTMIDRVSRWPEATILESKEATHIAAAFMKTWCSRYGVPTRVITDQEPVFMGQVLEELFNVLNVKTLKSTVYHPEGNAPIETFHRHLKKAMTVFELQQVKLTADEALQLALLSYRAVPNTRLGDTPAYFLFGEDITLPETKQWSRVNLRGEDYDRLRAIKQVREDLVSRARILADRDTKNRNQDRTEVTFTEGNLVVLRSSPTGVKRKLDAPWGVPHRVIKVWSNGKAALCQNLLTGDTQEAHIQNARFLSKPQTETQAQEWEVALEQDLKALEATQKPRVLKRFWQALQGPEEIERSPKRSKR